MDAIVIHQYGDRSVLNLEQIATPTPGEGELLVKVFACGVNRVDYKIANLVGEGRLKPVVGTTLPLADAARAHEMVEGGHAGGKVVLVVKDN